MSTVFLVLQANEDTRPIVEAIVIDNPAAVVVRQPARRGHGLRRVERVLVLHPVDDPVRGDEVVAAQGDEVVGVGGEALEPGEVVGHRDPHLVPRSGGQARRLGPREGGRRKHQGEDQGQGTHGRNHALFTPAWVVRISRDPDGLAPFRRRR